MSPLEQHPYKPYIPKNATRLIVGNFPIGKFSNPDRFHERKEGEMDFYYGGKTNRLWRLLGQCYNREMITVNQIKNFLKEEGFGLADVLLSCRRIDGSALDTALYDKTYNYELADLIQKKGITELFFTSKHVASEFKKHIGRFPDLKHVVLISPSPTAVRGLAKNREYLSLKKMYKDLSIEEFRLMKYKEIFYPRNQK